MSRKIKDNWNAFMVEGAKFTVDTEIPVCPTILYEYPKDMISYSEAKTIHNNNIRDGLLNYHVNSFIHFYIDDEKFDSIFKSIWHKPYEALEIITHFDGIITPDFSTYSDFPDPIKRYNTYRMRAFGYWIGTKNIQVINNLRWDYYSTDYCYEGIPVGSVIAIGTVASGLKERLNNEPFELELKQGIEKLKPHTIIIYGSSNYKALNFLKDSDIKIITFESQTSKVYSKEKSHE